MMEDRYIQFHVPKNSLKSLLKTVISDKIHNGFIEFIINPIIGHILFSEGGSFYQSRNN